MTRQTRLRGSLLVTLVAAAAQVVLAHPAQAGGGCGSPPSNGSGTTVEMTDFCFGPTVLRVSPGASVAFVNRDQAQHTVTGTAGRFGSTDPLAPQQSVSYRFPTNGVYAYSCIFHPGMTGAIVVGDGSGPGLASGPELMVVAAPRPAVVKATAPAAPTPPPTPLPVVGAAALVAGIAAGYLVGRSRRRMRATE